MRPMYRKTVPFYLLFDFAADRATEGAASLLFLATGVNSFQASHPLPPPAEVVGGRFEVPSHR